MNIVLNSEPTYQVTINFPLQEVNKQHASYAYLVKRLLSGLKDKTNVGQLTDLLFIARLLEEEKKWNSDCSR